MPLRSSCEQIPPSPGLASTLVHLGPRKLGLLGSRKITCNVDAAIQGAAAAVAITRSPVTTFVGEGRVSRRLTQRAAHGAVVSNDRRLVAIRSDSTLSV